MSLLTSYKIISLLSFLHFSKPDEGPLSSIDEWMPHFGDQLATGLTATVPVVQAALHLLTNEFNVFDVELLANVTRTMDMLITASHTWGQDFVLSLVDGMNAANPQLASGIQNIAKTISKFLHFSKPDEGLQQPDATFVVQTGNPVRHRPLTGPILVPGMRARHGATGP